MPTGTLSAVSQTARTFRNEEEVDSLSLYEERSSAVGFRADERRSVVQVEFTGTRGVEVARRLILARMKGETVHVKTRIRRSAYIRSTEAVWNVRVEEVSREHRE